MFTTNLHEGPLHTVDVFAVLMESCELIGGGAVRRGTAGGCFSIEQEMGPGVEEFGPADEAEVFCDAVEDYELLTCYV